jgi:agmatine/peptidylarginine deiminase
MPAQGALGFSPSFINGLIFGNTFLAPSYDVNDINNVVNSGANYPDGERFQIEKVEFEAKMAGLGYKVVWIPADDIIKSGGALHCISREYLNP